MFDYETLRIIWWLLLGVLLTAFAVTDGYDLGVGAILRLIARDDIERRNVVEAIEPHRIGRQVWFILGGGAVLAAWPLLYAASFCGFYFTMFLLVLALILRPVGFAFRGRLDAPRWRNAWDWALTVSGAVPALVFGVAIGNLFLGVPFHFTDTMLPVYDGSFLALFSPFALATGLVSLAMLVMHGASFAAMKAQAPVGSRASRTARIAALGTLLVFGVCGIWLFWIDGHFIHGIADHAAPSNPLGKEVWTADGAWLRHHGRYEWSLLLPASAMVALLAVAILRSRIAAFVASTYAVAAIIFTAGVALFPFILPSSVRPSHGLTVWDASSSQTTLGIMLFATVVLLPVVLAHSVWAFRSMHRPVTRAHVSHSKEVY